ncbi:tetratricopeptide repeat protein [Telmatospirillum siberiense]|uniref:Pilus assembly protein PilF n=1 Tax=Telmatospirillum siberiense TaxID=382514 RepID=A0A2N3PVM6_9PROT|nr:tetratricopeptide repeat protein [Telmatospirillum siberiense]PKU24441.1 pilus assembly protein PilF [Telmatospirillum siberiense]
MNRRERRAATKQVGGQTQGESLQKTFAEALRYHQAGCLAEAEILYRQILGVHPRHADSLHLLGVMASQVGRHDLAVDLIGKAIAIDAKADTYHSNLGFALQQLGRLDGAIDSYRKALQLKPRFPEAHNNLGNALSQRGQVDEAIVCYRDAIALKEDYPEAHNNLGLALLEQGRAEEALACFRKAIGFRPDYPEAHNNLGTALQELGRLDEAAACYRGAIDLNPEDPEAHNNLGVTLQKLGQLDDALACYRRACGLRADYPEAWFNLGTVYQRRERLDEAVSCYRQAIAHRPDYAAAYNNLGNTLRNEGRPEAVIFCYLRAIDLKPNDLEAFNNLGLALRKWGRFDASITVFHNALQLHPDDAETLNNLGRSLQELGEAGAGVCYRRAIESDPDDAEGYNHLGTALSDRECFDTAAAAFRNALSLCPNGAGIHNNFGHMHQELGNVAQAVTCYRRAVKSDAGDPEAHWNLALALLLTGDYRPGWAEYEWRWRCHEIWRREMRTFSQPPWSGEKSDGGTLLLWAEQGAGDSIQFVRYLPLVARLGWRIVIQIPGVLWRQFRMIPNVTVIAEGEDLPSFDVQCPLLSLPHLLGTTVQNIPATIPYLHAHPAMREVWRNRLRGTSGFKVGVVWRGNPSHKRDRNRSMDPAWFSRFLDIPGVAVVSLQKDGRGGEFSALDVPGAFLDAGPLLVDYADTAALIANLDLVISVDTSVAHLAGALGVPVWTLVDLASDWRWLLARDDSPWYPTMRLFRQSRLGDWQPVVERVRAELARLVEVSPDACLPSHASGVSGLIPSNV